MDELKRHKRAVDTVLEIAGVQRLDPLSNLVMIHHLRRENSNQDEVWIIRIGCRCCFDILSTKSLFADGVQARYPREDV